MHSWTCEYLFFMCIHTQAHDNTNKKVGCLSLISRQRPYHVEHTASRPISEVKQRWVWLVLGWVTAWEYQMLLAFYINSRPAVFYLLVQPSVHVFVHSSIILFPLCYLSNLRGLKKSECQRIK